MNPFALIGFVLILLYGAKCANAVPVTTHATDPASTAENATNSLINDEKLDKTLYNVIDTSNTLENNRPRQQPLSEQTTQKSHSETQRSRIKRKRGNRRISRMQHVSTTERTTTTKPTKVYILIPNLFISQGWGPNIGR